MQDVKHPILEKLDEMSELLDTDYFKIREKYKDEEAIPVEEVDDYIRNVFTMMMIDMLKREVY